jgi:hypothetical protein
MGGIGVAQHALVRAGGVRQSPAVHASIMLALCFPTVAVSWREIGHVNALISVGRVGL